MYISLLQYISVGLAAILVILSLLLFFIRIYKKLQRTKKDIVKTKTIQLIEELVLKINNPEYHPDWINPNLELILDFKKNYIDTSEFERKIVTHELLTLHRSLKDIASERIRDLYIRLGLDQIALNLLKNKKSYDHPKIIWELGQMRIIESIDLIKACLKYQDDKEIQIEASVALLVLQIDNPLVGIEHFTHMNKGQKQYFIESCKKLDQRNIPDFSLGFSSTNIHVVEICLILCDYFKQNYDSEIVRKLLKSPNPDITVAVANLLFKTNNYVLIKELLATIQNIEDVYVQVNLMKQIKLLEIKDLLDDLVDVINNPDTVDEVKLEALRSACRLSEKFDQTFTLEHIHVVDEKIKKMFLHAQERLI
ncbi:hypothetical protein [Aquirufa aurantiipilula]|uniref:HEAT repeat domain-containing protein n=1 Tax=Aquirufa aurantiipilula TaxID=2696561 RepID=A0ABT6BMW9_9BACT|nr:hypothetical protein [Aquirufa aurantiipilula]MDF5691737.1 hypothetical protein [Aquirufa aurantiipilula]